MTIIGAAAGRWSAATLLAASIGCAAQQRMPTAEEAECGTMIVPKRVEPMDYRTDRKLLPTVEGGHFMPNVENLIKPMFTTFGADLDYTLHAYPNHHRALVTLMRLGEREKTDQPKETRYTIDCYFRRALRQASDDAVARMLYAQYLISKNRNEDALRQLDVVGELAGENPFTHYNVGRLHMDLKSYDKAVLHAQRAAALGFEKPDLKEALVKLGKWPEAPEAAASVAAPASAPR